MNTKPTILKKVLVCHELIFQPGDVVDVFKATLEMYVVFLRNGWWAVPAEYFE